MYSMKVLQILALFGIAASAVAVAASDAPAKHIDELYPGLTSGALSMATPGELPEGVLLKTKDLELTSAELDEELAKAPMDVAEQLKKNKLLVLENMATRKLLLQSAQGEKEGVAAGEVSEKDLIQRYLDTVAAGVQVSDDEVAQFYAENKDMCGGASLEQVQDQLKQYVLGEKKQEAVTEHIRTFGERIPIVVAANWVEEEAKLALDNPVDKARASGKPSLVDFGSTGCRPCEMMAPILETLKTKYEGKANILFVHVREEQVLASRYAIRSIPVQVFFDKTGKEVYRHVGFYPQEEIEKRMKDLGVE